METANHYGNMRFAMFTVFTAMVGTLLAFPFSPGHAEFLKVDFHRYLFSAVGFVLSLLFGLSQHRISFLVTFYQETAFNLETVVGRARWCVQTRDWRAATTQPTGVGEEERQSQALGWTC